MVTASRSITIVIGLCLALVSVSLCGAQTAAEPAPAADDMARRMQELEKEMSALRAELAAMKPASSTASPAAAAPAEPAPAASAVSSTAPAAAPAPGPSIASLLGPTTISGFVDVYYDYNSNQPIGRTTAFRNFDINSSQFALNMIELVADKAPDTTNRAGYHIALGFGQAMNQINATEIGPGGTELNFSQYLKEGYLEYLAPVGKGLQINVGKFVTPAGAEVIETKDNWNYSRGILFSWAIPYFHFGASAKYAFNSKFALTGYLVNGWNNSVESNSGKTTGFSAAWTPNAKFSLIQNYLVGPEQFNDNSDYRHLFDTVMTYSPNSKLSFMANYDWGQDHPGGASAHWSGIAGYIKYAPNAKWAIATRGEYFNDHSGGFATGLPEKSLSEFTITLQRMLSNKIMGRLEYRRDMSDEAIFPYRTSGLEGSTFLPLSSQNTVTVGLVYAFSSADAK